MTEQQQIIMLKMPNSVELLRQMLINKICLSDEAEVAMFSAPNSFELVETYISRYPLCEKAKDLMFEHKDSSVLLKVYLENRSGYIRITSDDLMRMMIHPDAKKLAWDIMRNISSNKLPVDVVYKMCALDINLIDTYLREASWYQLNLFIERIEPCYVNAERAMVLALTRHRDLQLNENQQKAILRLKNAEELIRIYVHNERKVSLNEYYRRFRLCDKFIEKMATMSDGAELMKICIMYDLM